ncbi:hypothetical protein NFHSH190041_17070 [Shewanella sp. NFH-SH190041]|uniref:hypothetical protein n=1 Tax=Shewanella sp. NFH-SH190041 TaxID=2950245 RepID=UPI0021C2E3EA|nr:hypothetical protein [Shewanella sp. NFH-SH190041]BDM64255.1 hypothetical protein NFHSH190041_17070 [Shewanella sp. NFH-SH190041]
MNENYKYATHIISWVEKLGVPEISLAQNIFSQLKEYWIEHKSLNLEQLKDDLWSWVDCNDGYNIYAPEVAKMRIILCLAYEDNRELEDVGYFEDLLVSLGISREEAYKRT